MFSESWHHVAGERLALRAAVRIQRQIFRGELWYVLGDPFSNRFFRFRPEVYEFICRLDQRQTVGEIWGELWESSPDNAPSQPEVIQLLTQLHGANLITGTESPDSKALFERQRRSRARETRSKFSSVLFIRVPLIDPEAFLRRTWPVVRHLFSFWMWIPWLLVVALGAKSVVENWSEFASGTAGILAPSNLFLVTVTFFVLKLCHEFGHAYAVRKYGGEVHSMGIMFLIFTPIPFVDATAAWGFRERYKRVFVGSAGMIVEFFLAGIAAIVWARTGEGLINSLAFNATVIASISTLLFNINPLLRFDGYYILSDLLDYPNLQPRAQRQLLHTGERRLFGIPTSKSPAASNSEGFWLFSYGIASWLYRMIIMTSIMLFVADKFFGLGLIALVIAILGVIAFPLFKFTRYLISSQRLIGRRVRAVAVTAGIATALVVLLGIVPAPRHSRAAGVLWAKNHAEIVAGAAGVISTVDFPSKSEVEDGIRLLALENPELELSLQSARAELKRARTLEQLALASSTASIEPVAKQIEASQAKLALLEQESAELEVAARLTGVWVAPFVGQMIGVRVERGQKLGDVIDTSSFEFVAVVNQNDAAPFFEDAVSGAAIRLPGAAGAELKISSFEIVPSQQHALPSAALGTSAGGTIDISQEDGSGRVALEPFFVVRAVVETDPDGAQLLHGRTGAIRFDLPAEPLASQWVRAFRQLLQKRFRI